MSTEKGRKAEDAACDYLKKHGYDILDRNRRLGRGELDIVALKEDLLVFVEVKAHQQRDSSLLAMHANKCSRFVSAANAWLGQHKAYADSQCRFDLMLVMMPQQTISLAPEIDHMMDVIRL